MKLLCLLALSALATALVVDQPKSGSVNHVGTSVGHKFVARSEEKFDSASVGDSSVDRASESEDSPEVKKIKESEAYRRIDGMFKRQPHNCGFRSFENAPGDYWAALMVHPYYLECQAKKDRLNNAGPRSHDDLRKLNFDLAESVEKTYYNGEIEVYQLNLIRKQVLKVLDQAKEKNVSVVELTQVFEKAKADAAQVCGGGADPQCIYYSKDSFLRNVQQVENDVIRLEERSNMSKYDYLHGLTVSAQLVRDLFNFPLEEYSDLPRPYMVLQHLKDLSRRLAVMEKQAFPERN